jgi:amino acid adenylation domain-containing protein
MMGTGDDPVVATLSAEDLELLASLLNDEGLEPMQARIVPRKGDLDEIPLSFSQERLWFLDQLDPGSPLYRISANYRILGHLDVGALEQSLNRIVERHAALRTSFPAVDGQPVQAIAVAQQVRLDFVDLTDHHEKQQKVAVQEALRAQQQLPFDLARGPLLRAALLRIREEEHVFLMSMHHIISDGWSMGILRQELSALYDSLSSHRPSPLPGLPIQYADYAVWQREWLQGEALQEQLAYWQRHLGGTLPTLQLPTDRARPALQSYRGSVERLTLDSRLSRSLRSLSQTEDITLFMTMLAVFEILLRRYTGQDDIILGTVIANRNRAEIEGLIGFFANTLVLRTDLSGDPTGRELLRRVREVTLGAYAHQDLPFEKLVETLKPNRDWGVNPLFQVMFTMQHAPGKQLTLGQLDLQRLRPDRGVAHFDLSMNVISKPESLECALEYSSDLFDSSTVLRMLAHYRTLLQGMVADPDRHLSELPLLTGTEQNQILVTWNRTRADYPRDRFVHQLFEDQVERDPNAVAAVFGDREFTYGQLNVRANQLAHYLHDQGVGPEVLVGSCFERSLEAAIGILAVLKAGGAYVPLDPLHPQDRLIFMLEDAQVALVLTQEQLQARLPSHLARVICIDSEWAGIATDRVTNPESGVAEGNVAYVIFTSGSTGRPKGVMVTHGALCNRILWEQDVYQCNPTDRVLQHISYSFDFSVWEFFIAWTTGARVVMAQPEEALDASRLARLIAEKEVTIAGFVPTMLEAVIDVGSLAAGHSLRQVFSGAEVLSPELKQRCMDQLGTSLYNTYGPTEATIDVTHWPCSAEHVEPLVPIGRPIGNTEVYILDPYLQPVSVGVPGELCVAGAALARGYLNRAGATAEKFVPHPFGREPGSRLYRTGDLARFRPDGAIEFLGRIDRQVKVRGFRIELGEVETALAQHPRVGEAIVQVRPDVSGNDRLVAYVVPAVGCTLTTSELRAFLGSRLPDYMVPTSYVTLNKLPLTPSGKLDRKALPEAACIRPDLEEALVAPRTHIEKKLEQLWAQLLGLDQVGIHDNFFDLGGHSMLAVRLLARINKEFGVDLPLISLYQATTIQQIGEALSAEQQLAPAWSSLVAMKPSGTRPPLFVAPGNLGNVFTDLGHMAKYLGPEQPFYGFQDNVQNPTQVEALAAHYIKEVRLVQPVGPYFIGGVCSGGIVAFEMARQLQAQGQEVLLLALIEPSPPPIPGPGAYLKFARSTFSRFWLRVGSHLRRIGQQSPVEWGEYLRLKRRVMTNSWAVLRYSPQPLAGRIELFLTEGSLKSAHNRQLTWGEYAKEGAQVHAIPGSHATIVGVHDIPIEEAHMRALAEQLTVCINHVLES